MQRLRFIKAFYFIWLYFEIIGLRYEWPIFWEKFVQFCFRMLLRPKGHQITIENKSNTKISMPLLRPYAQTVFKESISQGAQIRALREFCIYVSSKLIYEENFTN